VKQKFVVHTVDSKVVSRQSYGSNYGGDQIIADRLLRDERLDPFTRNGEPIKAVWEDRFAYTK